MLPKVKSIPIHRFSGLNGDDENPFLKAEIYTLNIIFYQEKKAIFYVDISCTPIHAGSDAEPKKATNFT